MSTTPDHATCSRILWKCSPSRALHLTSHAAHGHPKADRERQPMPKLAVCTCERFSTRLRQIADGGGRDR
jgi:hypothetical protein